MLPPSKSSPGILPLSHPRASVARSGDLLDCRVKPGNERGEEKTPYEPAEYEYGRLLPEASDAAYRSYLLDERDKKMKLQETLKMQKTSGAGARVEELTEEITGLNWILNKF